MSRGVGTDEVEGTVTFLERYVDKHFGDEERLLRTWRYPAFEAHKAMHDRFVQELRELKADLRAGKSKTLLTLQIQRKVSDWLVNHIKKSDMEYASFARKAA
jgi:hemerythrin-like metal-binding protein